MLVDVQFSVRVWEASQGPHCLDLVSWVGKEVWWPGEELGEVDEYDQNILYKIPKQLIKSKRERQFEGKGVYSGSQLRGTGYSREQKVEAAGHIQSTTRKQKVMKA